MQLYLALQSNCILGNRLNIAFINRDSVVNKKLRCFPEVAYIFFIDQLMLYLNGFKVYKQYNSLCSRLSVHIIPKTEPRH